MERVRSASWFREKTAGPEGKARLVSAVCLVLVSVVALEEIIRWALVWNATAFFTVLLLQCLVLLFTAGALFAGCAFFHAVACAIAFAAGFFCNYFPTLLDNLALFLSAAFSLIAFVLALIFAIKAKTFFTKTVLWFLLPVFVLAVVLIPLHGGLAAADKNSTEYDHQRYAVPSSLDGEESAEKGTVVSLTYDTKAYATDGRDVTKTAYVYLPYGYSEENSYDILYLMHGTGDVETYWLVENEYNVTMLDNMIRLGIIDPLIVVTPTWYTEDDYVNDPDVLTYYFGDELRSDLMPVVEAAYSTYAEDCTEEGFAASRTHRAFAGLSRGASTTLRSVMHGNLDYFSSYGTFSGSWVEDIDEFVEELEDSGYGIDLWYITGGNFDFALYSQLSDLKKILKKTDAFVMDENVFLDVYPLRYHSMGSWHLALYNFLLEAF